MDSLHIWALVAATVGSGLMAGLFCSFSSFLMTALSQIPPTKGAAAMQSINVVIVRPSFLAAFFGTAVATVVATVSGWDALGGQALGLTVAGGSVYTVGCLVVTVVFNVPLNDRLAAVDSESAEGRRMWAIYLSDWVRWNHVRSVATLVSTLLLVLAVLRAA